MSRRILIVASEYDPFNSSGIIRIKAFRKVLMNAGYHVFVLAADASVYGLSSDKEIDAKRRIVRARGLPHSMGRVLKTRYLPIDRWLGQPDSYYHWLPHAKRVGLQLIDKEQIDTIFCSFPNYSALQVGHYLASKKDLALSVDFRDPPPFLIDTNYVACPKEAVIIRNCLMRANAVTAATENTKREIVDHYGLDAQASVIANGYDEELVNALPAHDPQPSDVFQVMHIGSFYSVGRDIVRVVRALEGFQRHKRPERKLVLRLIGDEPWQEEMTRSREIARHIELICEPPCSNHEALRRAKAADALLLLQGDLFDRQIPAKTYEYLALSRPIWAVVGNEGATRKFLELYPENVIFSDYCDPEKIRASVHDLLNLESVEIDVSELSRQVESTKLLSVIEAL